MLKFDPEKHEYSRNGKRLPSVTEIIGLILYPDQFKYVKAEYMERAIEFGSLVHKTLETEFTDPLTAEELHSYNEAVRILKENNVQPIFKERRLYSKMGYAGTADLYAEMNGKLVIIDYKTGSQLYKDQTAWQQSMYKVMLEEQGLQVDEIYALHIPRNKKGKLVKLNPRHLIKVKWLIKAYKERTKNE